MTILPPSLRALALTALLATGLSMPGVKAQELDNFAACTGFSNDIERLACFDKAAAGFGGATTKTAGAECKAMTVEDLKLDYQDVLGSCAEIKGLVLQAGEAALLMQSQMDASPFFIDTTSLTRDERKILLNCPTGCQLTVTGIVQEVNYGKGLKAATIRQ